MNEKGLQLELVNNLLKKMETERLSYEVQHKKKGRTTRETSCKM